MSISAFAVRRRGEAGNWNFAGHGNSTRRNDHEIHADSKGHQRFRSRQDAQRGNDQRDGEVQPGPGQSGGSGRCGGSIPQLQRRARPNLRQRKENGDRWTIRRIEGVGRRLLAYQGEFARRSDRVGQAISSYAGPGHRNRSARVYRVRITFRGCPTFRRLARGAGVHYHTNFKEQIYNRRVASTHWDHRVYPAAKAVLLTSPGRSAPRDGEGPGARKFKLLLVTLPDNSIRPNVETESAYHSNHRPIRSAGGLCEDPNGVLPHGSDCESRWLFIASESCSTAILGLER